MANREVERVAETMTESWRTHAGSKAPYDGGGRILLVEDNLTVADALAGLLRRHASTHRVDSIRAARTVVRLEPEWLAAIVDVGLPDGSGVDLAAEFGRDPLRIPVLVVTDIEERRIANEAQRAGARFAFKPIGRAEIDCFMSGVLANRSAARVDAAFDAIARAAGWSMREREVVRHLLAGTPRREIAAQMKVEESTSKSQIRSLLSKCGERDVDAVVRRILVDATKPVPGVLRGFGEGSSCDRAAPNRTPSRRTV